MRPIDADVLDSILQDAQAECKKNGGNFRFGVLSNIRANIADAPTIDAIPVDWLKDRANDITRAPLYRRYAQMLMNEWQNEQEAR